MSVARRALAARSVIGCALALVASAAPAADDPALSPAHAALTGFWHSVGPDVGGGERLGRPRGGPALAAALPKQQPWAAAKHTADMAAQAAGEYRPTAQMMCYPAHVPGTGLPQFSNEIALVVEPRQVTFLYEVNRIIRIAYLNQDHPANLTPSWMGHSVARWDGDTLIVDTVGYNDKNDLDRGVPMTSKMHIVQRMRMVGDRLEIQATFDDPGAFTGPFTVTNSYEREEPFQETICPENNQEGGVPTSTGERTKPILDIRPAK